MSPRLRTRNLKSVVPTRFAQDLAQMIASCKSLDHYSSRRVQQILELKSFEQCRSFLVRQVRHHLDVGDTDVRALHRR